MQLFTRATNSTFHCWFGLYLISVDKGSPWTLRIMLNRTISMHYEYLVSLRCRFLQQGKPTEKMFAATWQVICSAPTRVLKRPVMAFLGDWASSCTAALTANGIFSYINNWVYIDQATLCTDWILERYINMSFIGWMANMSTKTKYALKSGTGPLSLST